MNSERVKTQKFDN